MEESSKSVANTAQSVAQSSKTVERGNENGGRGNGREHGTNDERGEIRISGERRGQTVQDSGRKGRSMEEGTGRTARRLMDIAGESLAAELRGSEYFDGFEQADEISGRSTGIDLQSRDRYSREMNDIIDGYLDSTNEKLVDFITRYNSSGKYERMSLISVTDRQKADIERLTGIDVSGYTNAINTNAIEHIERRHGKNGKSDSTMKDIHDVARVEFILENYDKVIISKKADEVPSKEFRDKYDRPAPTLIFSKKINGTYYTVLAVPESSWKKIWIVSAFMDKKEDAISYAPDVQAPRLRPTTPRTAIASSDTQKISQSNKKSKKNFSDDRVNFFSGFSSGTAPKDVLKN